MTAPGIHTQGVPLLERSAAAALAGVRTKLGPAGPVLPPPKRLTEAEQREAAEVIAKRGVCRFCAGLHAGGDLSCPRLASFELDGDGNVKRGSFWRDGEWDTSRVLFAEDVEEPAEDDSGRDS